MSREKYSKYIIVDVKDTSMADFALLVYQVETERTDSFGDSIRSILNAAKGFFKAKGIRECIEKVELYEDLNMLLIKLPFSYNKYARFNRNKRNALIKEISEACLRENIKICVHPCKPTLSDEDCMIKNCFSGQRLYLALVVNILDSICSAHKIRPCDLNLGIIPGEDREKLRILVKMLSSHIKYLTVISSDKHSIERAVNGIYPETGLSVAVSSNLKRGLEVFDVLICTTNPEKLKFTAALGIKPLIINYDEFESDSENIINGIRVEIPVELKMKLHEDIFENYRDVELAEALLIHRGMNVEDITKKPYDFHLIKNLAEYFKKDCYSIIGFSGKIKHL